MTIEVKRGKISIQVKGEYVDDDRGRERKE